MAGRRTRRSSRQSPMTRIPVNRPLLDGNEARYLTECITTGWISSEGPFVRRLEESLATLCKRTGGVAVANGTCALDAAVHALNLPAGSEVIMPSMTIISCITAVLRAGCVPRLVDCDPDTWNMRTDDVRAALNDKTGAIMAVHIYGLTVDMDPILQLASENGLKVVEDASEAIGLRYKDRMCGSMGHLSTLSFYPNKNITTGEGGMILANDAALLERCRSLRNLCFLKEQRFLHRDLGWNFRMSNLQAAVGCAQFERLDEFLQIRRRMGLRYRELLQDVGELHLPIHSTPYADNGYWVFGVVPRDAAPTREKLVAYLAGKGVETRPFFWGLHEQPVFAGASWLQGLSLPHTERLGRRGFYLPSGIGITDEEIVRVVDIMKEALLACRN